MKYDYWLKYGLPTALLALGLTSRILFIGQYLGEWDEVDFALAVRDYDIVAQQPHFPGYPVYVWFSQIAMCLTKEEVRALGLVSALFGGLAVLPLYYLALSMYSRRIAVLAAVLFLTNPACWLYSERPLSEATGIFFLLLSLYFLSQGLGASHNPWPPALGSFFMGITLGVRLDYFPFLSVLFYVLTCTPRKYNIAKIFCFFGAFALGVILWLVPMVNVVGMKVLLHQALGFTQGHFADWGGSIVTVSHPATRLSHLTWGIFPAGLGFWWIDLPYMQLLPSLCLLLGFYAFLQEKEYGKQKRFFLIILLPYLLWVFFAQNIEKPRHVLPLIPLLLLAASAGLLRKRPQSVAMLGFLTITVIIFGAYSFKLIRHYSQSRPPLMQLVNYVTSASSGFDQLSTRVYCGETKRLFEYYAPGWDARRARNLEGLRYDFRASLYPPPNLLATSEVMASDDLNGRCLEIIPIGANLKLAHNDVSNSCLRLIKRFKEDRYIYAPYHEIVLLRVDSSDF